MDRIIQVLLAEELDIPTNQVERLIFKHFSRDQNMDLQVFISYQELIVVRHSPTDLKASLRILVRTLAWVIGAYAICEEFLSHNAQCMTH